MIFQCSGVELDTTRFSLTKDGEPVPVAPKVFDLLVYLIRHRDRVVTRAQLVAEVWNGRLISDGTLSNEIKLARAALGDDGVQQKYIQTVRGRGYRFVGVVTEIPQPAAPEPGAASGPLSADAVEELPPPARATALSRNHPAIAVLPFDNRSAHEADAYFTDGFHDELITHISKIRKLATISRTSVMAYRHSQKSVGTIARELNCTCVIEGAVQRAGDQIRITVQLIDALKDEHLWAETYTRTLTAQNVFAIQSEIALTVATSLRTVLSPEEQQQLTETPTRHMAALEAYFRGRVSYGLATCEGFSAAIEHFRQAIELDPDFAQAHAQLAMALLERVHFGGLDVEAQNQVAEPVIRRALRLNPQLSEAYEALGFLERHRGAFDASEVAYERAIQLNPNNTSALRMFGYFKSWDCEQPKEALEHFSRARLLDPQSHHTLSLMGQALMDLERFDESRAALHAAIATAPTAVPPHQMLGQLYAWKLCRHDEAIKAFQRAFHLDPGVPWTTFFLAVAYEELGLSARAAYFFEWCLHIAPEKGFSWIARLKLHRLNGEREREADLLRQIIDGRLPVEPWHDVLHLNGLDLRYDHPALAVELFEALYPALRQQPELAIETDNNLFKLALAYTTVLHLTGAGDMATELTERLTALAPSRSRYGWRGIDLMDAWLFAAIGDSTGALSALRDWHRGGGCKDLTRTALASAALQGEPEYQALCSTLRTAIGQQRANLARMEQGGELAPVDGLPALETP
ncbi:MAG: winged helix-turn-helix domain-containing protein [Pseudomonadota bacterium]